ncbi:MAG: CoA-binding protein [Chitinophagaceae bacterium]
MSAIKKTLVLGASANSQRYSYLAINKLRKFNHPVLGIGKVLGKVGDVNINVETKFAEGVDTITLYLSAANQKQYYDYILSLHPKRIIFNPGAENDELFEIAQQNGIQPMEACTLVMLSTGQY